MADKSRQCSNGGRVSLEFRRLAIKSFIGYGFRQLTSYNHRGAMNIPGLLNILKAGRGAVSLGIDIGAGQIKAVKAVSGTSGVKFSNVIKENIVNGDAQAAFCRITAAFPEVKEVNLSISGSNSVVMRYITMPQMDKKELFQALKFEASKYVPFPLEEVYFDAQIMSAGAPSDNKMQVLLAAARKELVNQRLEMAERAGVKVKCVDIDCLAVFNAFNAACPEALQSSGKRTFALLNIGEQNSNLDIIESGNLRLSRDLHQGAAKIIERISVVSSLNQASVSEALANGRQETQDEFGRAFSQAVSELAMELRVSFDYYESQSSAAVSGIQLSGEASGWQGFVKQLSEVLGLTIEAWEPLRNYGIDALSAVPDGGKGFAVAAGLALRK